MKYLNEEKNVKNHYSFQMMCTYVRKQQDKYSEENLQKALKLFFLMNNYKCCIGFILQKNYFIQ